MLKRLKCNLISNLIFGERKGERKKGKSGCQRTFPFFISGQRKTPANRGLPICCRQQKG